MIDVCHTADHRMSADLQKLIYPGIATENSPVIDFDVTGDTDIVGENRVAPHHAVVSNVHIGHEQIVAANSRQPAAGLGTAMQVRPFAQDIVIANLKPGFFAMKFLICGVFTDRTKLENSIVLANLCVARIMTWESITVPEPICTLGPMIVQGPIVTSESISALGSILALESIDIHLPLCTHNSHCTHQLFAYAGAAGKFVDAALVGDNFCR